MNSNSLLVDYLFKPTIHFKSDNLSTLLAWQYNEVETPEDLIEYTLYVFEELDYYRIIERMDVFEEKLVEEKIQILKEICYPLYAYITNKSFETKQFKEI